MPRRPSKSDSDQHNDELGNASRNERQKTVLLCEMGRLNRKELDRLIQDSKGLVSASKMLVEESKKLCKRAESADEQDSKRKA